MTEEIEIFNRKDVAVVSANDTLLAALDRAAVVALQPVTESEEDTACVNNLHNQLKAVITKDGQAGAIQYLTQSYPQFI